jgi:hypothetical protein
MLVTGPVSIGTNSKLFRVLLFHNAHQYTQTVRPPTSDHHRGSLMLFLKCDKVDLINELRKKQTGRECNEL